MLEQYLLPANRAEDGKKRDASPAATAASMAVRANKIVEWRICKSFEMVIQTADKAADRGSTWGRKVGNVPLRTRGKEGDLETRKMTGPFIIA
jgi:hypothetical protein